MRTAILNKPQKIGNHPLQIIDKDIPRPETGEVLIKVAACGVCHTDWGSGASSWTSDCGNGGRRESV